MSADTKDQMLMMAAQTVDEQATALLKAFTATFAGDFTTIFKMAEEFKHEVRVGEEGKDPNAANATLNELHAMKLLGEGTISSVALRKYLQDIFLLESGAKGRPEVRFSFVAWVLFKFSLSPADLFVVQTEHQHDSVKETHAAMTAYQQYLIKEGE
eukprot:gene25857-2380_t